MYVKFLDGRPLANDALEKDQVRVFWAVSDFMLQLWLQWYFAATAPGNKTESSFFYPVYVNRSSKKTRKTKGTFLSISRNLRGN